MQAKSIGLTFIVVGIVGAILTALPYVLGSSHSYNVENVNIFGFVSSGIFLAGIALMLTGNPKKEAR